MSRSVFMRTQFGEPLRFQDVVLIPPASLPVDINAVKLHARIPVDLDVEDSDIWDKIREATAAVEQDSNRSLIIQQRQLSMDRWPLRSPNEFTMESLVPTNDIEILHCPVIGIDGVQYTDYNGVLQTWDASKYQVNLNDEPARLRYIWGGYWPPARLQENSIVVKYHAGYVAPFTAAGNTLTVAGFVPQNGQMLRMSNSGGALPSGLARYTDYYVISAAGQSFQLSLTLSGSAVTINDAGSGMNLIGASGTNGEVNPLAIQAIYLRVAMEYCDREGAEYSKCRDGYWSKINGLKYQGW